MSLCRVCMFSSVLVCLSVFLRDTFFVFCVYIISSFYLFQFLNINLHECPNTHDFVDMPLSVPSTFFKIYSCVYKLPRPTRNVCMACTCIHSHIQKKITITIWHSKYILQKETKNSTHHLHEKHKFIHKTRKTWLHNETNKETHKHKLTNRIIITWIHLIHNTINKQPK